MVVVVVVVERGQLSSLHLTTVLTQRQIEQPSGPSRNSSRSRYQLPSCKHENGAGSLQWISCCCWIKFDLKFTDNRFWLCWFCTRNFIVWLSENYCCGLCRRWSAWKHLWNELHYFTSAATFVVQPWKMLEIWWTQFDSVWLPVAKAFLNHWNGVWEKLIYFDFWVTIERTCHSKEEAFEHVREESWKYSHFKSHLVRYRSAREKL